MIEWWNCTKVLLVHCLHVLYIRFRLILCNQLQLRSQLILFFICMIQILRDLRSDLLKLNNYIYIFLKTCSTSFLINYSGDYIILCFVINKNHESTFELIRIIQPKLCTLEKVRGNLIEGAMHVNAIAFMQILFERLS